MATVPNDSPDDVYGEKPPSTEDSDSRGSSVSSRLQEEYESVLKSAILMPNVESIPAIVEQFLGQVAREVDTYPPEHPFSSARLVDLSDDENPRSMKPVQVSKEPKNNMIDLNSADIIDVIGTEFSATSSADSQDKSQKENFEKDILNRSRQNATGGSEAQLQVVDSTSNTDESDKILFPSGALPKSRFIPEMEPSFQCQPPNSKPVKSQKTRAPLVYSAPIRSSTAKCDISGTSALEQLVNTGGDADLIKTENLLDQWSGELKRNILAEFGQAKCRIAGNFHAIFNKEKERHTKELRSFREEIDSVRELLATYELSLTRKDQVISNLTQSLHRHRDRLDMQRRFSEWRQQHADKKREAFCNKLAVQHYERKLYRTIWDAWHSLLVGKWRHRVERACQAKAQDVCLQLTNDYEAKIASANEALEASRIEVQKLHRERDWYEENMKKAFMRGVCALNMEALGMFRPPENDDEMDGEEKPFETDKIPPDSDPQMPNLPFFGTAQAQSNLSNSAPVYTVHRENSVLKGSSTFNGRRSGTENAPPGQRVLRAHMIARDPRPVSAQDHAAARRGSPMCRPSQEYKKVHFSTKKT